MNNVSKADLAASFKREIELSNQVLKVAEDALKQLTQPESIEYWKNVKIEYQQRTKDFEDRIKRLKR